MLQVGSAVSGPTGPHSPLTTTAMSTKSISPRASTLASQRYTPSSALVTWRICRLLLARTWYLPSHGDAAERQEENVRLNETEDLIGRHGRPALAPPPNLMLLDVDFLKCKKGRKGTKTVEISIRLVLQCEEEDEEEEEEVRGGNELCSSSSFSSSATPRPPLPSP